MTLPLLFLSELDIIFVLHVHVTYIIISFMNYKLYIKRNYATLFEP